MVINLDDMREWVGRIEVRSDQIVPVPLAALTATLDRDEPMPEEGDLLPPLRHWLYFLPLNRHDEIGQDGQARRGGFLPPIELPRCIWAGSRLQFRRPLRVGDAISRTSCIVDVSRKEGRSGPLVFVLVRHEIGDADGIALSEEQDIVYRDRPARGATSGRLRIAPSGAAWSREIHPDEVTLFRYSALTFNAHRIHYDRDYATEIEGYPGLVVQGRLVATLLLDLLHRHMPGVDIHSFSFRTLRPLFDIEPFSICGKRQEGGKTALLWAKDAQGWLAMEAVANLV